MPTRLVLTCGGAEFSARLSNGEVNVDGDALMLEPQPDGSVTVGPSSEDGRATAWAVRDGDRVWVFLNGCVYQFERKAPGWTAGAARRHDQLTAPMPASVRQVLVEPGQRIRKGDTLILLEAMKMELPVRAGADGTVRAVLCQPGDLVQPGVPLLDLDDAT